MLDFFLAPYRSASQHRHLLRALAEREIRTTFEGSLLGAAWLVIQPLCTLAVYALVFGGILGIGNAGSGMGFVSSMFAGMVVYQAFSETVSRSPRLVVARPNFVTKVAFPLDLLPWPIVALAALHATISILILIALHWLLVATPAWTALLLPLLLVPGLLLGLGLGWMLAGLGVYVRDVQDVVRVALQLLFFLTPIIWTVDSIQDATLVMLVQLNPLAVMIDSVRWALSGNGGPGAIPVLIAAGVSFAAAACGHRFFQRVKGGFADVL